MNQSPTYNDPDFGPMTFAHGQWELERRAMLGERAVLVCVEPELEATRELSSVQREAVRQALSLSPDALRASAPAVVQNYEVYREALGDDELPPLADPVQVWDEVTFSYIVVQPHADIQIPTFLLMAECSWDPEHGLVVRFRNGVADAASQQGELGMDD